MFTFDKFLTESSIWNTISDKKEKSTKTIESGKGQLITDTAGNQFLILPIVLMWQNKQSGISYELYEKLVGTRKYQKKSVSTKSLVAMQQTIAGRIYELGTTPIDLIYVDDNILTSTKVEPKKIEKVGPKKHHEKTLQEYTLERAKKNKLPANHAGNAHWARIEHHDWIKRALAAGTKVDPEILEDYPEFDN